MKQYIDNGEDYHLLPSLEAREELLNPRKSLAHSVDVRVKANVATRSGASRVNHTPACCDKWIFGMCSWA